MRQPTHRILSRKRIDRIMQHIFDTNTPFHFENITLVKPTVMAGGNHFIRFLVNQQPIYIQPPKCKTKQGILRVGKRFYTDLVFTHENEKFIQWMENLETYCQEYIYKNRKEWFDGDMEMHDVETYFSSPLKIYKSGKYYNARVNITPVLGKPVLKIYDEQEQEVAMDALNDKTDIMTILEIQGIKCSARSFQIEMEIKQILVLHPVDIFEKCLLSRKPDAVGIARAGSLPSLDKPEIVQVDPLPALETSGIALENSSAAVEFSNVTMEVDETTSALDANIVDETATITESSDHEENDDIVTGPSLEEYPLDKVNLIDGMQEIEIPLDELIDGDPIYIKERNDVYYEMYREARRKAKIARDLALSSYLEAKRIKNTYMLDDINDSDEDSEMGSEDGEGQGEEENLETISDSTIDLEKK